MPHMIMPYFTESKHSQWDNGKSFHEAITEEGPVPSLTVMRFESSLTQTLLTFS